MLPKNAAFSRKLFGQFDAVNRLTQRYLWSGSKSLKGRQPFARNCINNYNKVIKNQSTHFSTTSFSRSNMLNLPTEVLPVHYDLSIRNMDTEQFTYDGKIRIFVNIKSQVEAIHLNTNDLTYKSAVYKENSSSEEKTVEWDIDESSQIIKFFSKDKTPFVVNSEGYLEINFLGKLNDTMSGFYRSKYIDPDGTQKYLYSTQFESYFARRCFPCFDEPAMKATFDITISTPSEFTAISNMPEVESDSEPQAKRPRLDVASEQNSKIFKFQTTPIMSTYLVGFVVGEMEFIESTSKNPISEGDRKDTKVRLYTTKGNVELGKFALGEACNYLTYFGKVFGINYALPKMDLIAIPEFAHGAMENWGVVTFRASALLHDPKKSSTPQKVRCSYIVAHELAHQWFGNLVTMEWWNALWLNESFATWVGWYAVDHYHKEWSVWDGFLLESTQPALDLDSVRGSHPVQVPVKTLHEVEQAFDAISYMKGGTCVNMLASFLGEELFLKGVSAYLQNHKYGNAKTDDLWAALQDQLGEDSNVKVKDFMDTWILTIGYPLVSASKSDSKVQIKQQRYLVTGDLQPEEDTTIWPIPLEAIDAQGKKQSLPLFRQKELSTENDFLILNKDRKAFYRVHYSPELVNDLGPIIQKKESLNASDRIGIVADAGSTSESGFSRTSEFLDLVNYFSDEDNFHVWYQLSHRLEKIRSVWYKDTEVDGQLKKLELKIYGPVLEKLGFDSKPGESDLNKRLRALLLRKLGAAGEKTVIDAMQKKFQKYINNDENAIEPDLRSLMFAIAVSSGSEAEFEKVMEIYNKTNSNELKEMTLDALSRTKDEKLWKQLLEFTLTDKVFVQDFHVPFFGLISRVESRSYTWNYITENWDRIWKRIGTNEATAIRFVRNTTRLFSDKESIQGVKDFFENKDKSIFESVLNQSLDECTAAMNWLNRDNEDVKQWLKKL